MKTPSLTHEQRLGHLGIIATDLSEGEEGSELAIAAALALVGDLLNNAQRVADAMERIADTADSLALTLKMR